MVAWVLLTIFIAFFATNFLGYWVHRFIHQPIAGPLYRSHQEHHNVHYPPGKFYSVKYRSSGKDSAVYSFVVIFSPILGLLGYSIWAGWINPWISCSALVAMITAGLMHYYIHDGTHLTRSVFRILPGFRRWQVLHIRHHQMQNKNFSIFSFWFDRVFGTFSETNRTK